MQLLLFNLDGMEHTRLRSSQYGHHEPMPNSSSTTTAQTSSDIHSLSWCPRTSPFRLHRSAYGYAARLVLADIQMLRVIRGDGGRG